MNMFNEMPPPCLPVLSDSNPRSSNVSVGTYETEVGTGAYLRTLDLTPLGRQEQGLPYGMAWVRHHDQYDARGSWSR